MVLCQGTRGSVQRFYEGEGGGQKPSKFAINNLWLAPYSKIGLVAQEKHLAD
jgi:hypothetical protein